MTPEQKKEKQGWDIARQIVPQHLWIELDKFVNGGPEDASEEFMDFLDKNMDKLREPLTLIFRNDEIGKILTNGFKNKTYPKIDFSFSGQVKNATIKEVTDLIKNTKVDVVGITAETLIRNLQKGRWAINFADVYDEADDTECEMTEYEES